AVLAALLALANGSSRFSPDFLSEVVLYALLAGDLTMLVALGFVLARNIVKLVVERRRALPFARFRAKLVLLLLANTFVPAVLVLLVGSELIRTSMDRWFNTPMDEILSSANQIASDYYHERQMLVRSHAARMARTLAAADLSAGAAPIRELLAPDVTLQRVQLIQIYRATPSATALPRLERVVEVAASALPAGDRSHGADRLAANALSNGTDADAIETLTTSGDLLHAAAVIHAG